MDDWEFMESRALRASRSGRVCITCQHFTYETDAYITLDNFPYSGKGKKCLLPMLH